jgi:glycosyltransferase involved in cell wall biosynthesis
VRVLLVGERPPPPGGVVTHVAELARALAARGVAVALCDPRRRDADGRDGRPRLIARLVEARVRGDLVHVHTNGHNRGSWRVAQLGSLGRPSLLTLHSGMAPAYIDAHASLVRRVCAGYATVIAVSPPIAAALARARVERVVMTPAFSPSGLAFRLAPPGLAQLRRAHPLLLASALAPAPEYGAQVLVDGFARVHGARPDAGLIVYGPGTRATLGPIVRSLGLARAVALYDTLPRERALAVVAACDLFVRATLADGDAISVREALALGRPVVASAVGERPEGALTFTAGSSAALAEAIFHSVGKRAPALPPPTDCLPTIFELYRRCGLDPGTIGTRLATA